MKHSITRRSFINDRSTIRALHSHDSRMNVLVAQAVEPSRSRVYSILEKIGDALETGAKVVDGGTRAVGKVFSFLPPLSIGIGFGTGCGVGIGWSFQQVRREGLTSPPRVRGTRKFCLGSVVSQPLSHNLRLSSCFSISPAAELGSELD
mmetsp:Transcript_17642/g.71273  ORF Transcript_17642/g.71273 Transcript_17642/m.71273 type:complete len:149 (-) Transcript_17642:753-1199(-)